MPDLNTIQQDLRMGGWMKKVFGSKFSPQSKIVIRAEGFPPVIQFQANSEVLLMENAIGLKLLVYVIKSEWLRQQN